MLNTLIKILTSVRIAIVLLIIITVLCVIATLIPQGRDEAFYLAQYGGALTDILRFTGLDRFFQSLFFIVPLALFFINLAACSVHRFITRLGNKARKRFGPDLIHLGLMVLIVAGIVTATGREKAFVYMKPGDAWHLPDGYVLELKDFEFSRYADGRPQDWISYVRVTNTGTPGSEDAAIEVNVPLAIGGVLVYQTDWKDGAKLVLEEEAGEALEIFAGEAIATEKNTYLVRGFTQTDDGLVAVLTSQGGATFTLAYGSTLDEYTIRSIDKFYFTGLQAIRDPGIIPILISFIIIAAGLCLTYVQKLGEKK